MIPKCNLNIDKCCLSCTRYNVCYVSCLFQPIHCDYCEYYEYNKLKSEENKKMENQETIFFARTNETVVIPSKNEENAGYDIYANFSDDFVAIPPHNTFMIPTGLISACDAKYYFQLFERGSTGTKGIAQRCGE